MKMKFNTEEKIVLGCIGISLFHTARVGYILWRFRRQQEKETTQRLLELREKLIQFSYDVEFEKIINEEY